MSDLWGADTPVSLPSQQEENPPVVDLGGGFGFGAGGLCHIITEADIEQLIPTFTPPPRTDDG